MRAACNEYLGRSRAGIVVTCHRHAVRSCAEGGEQVAADESGQVTGPCQEVARFADRTNDVLR